MLSIEVELLTGRYAATQYNDRWTAEWPPHPARFFSALVAALHDQAPVSADERSALEWLEEQGAPDLTVDLGVGDDTAAGRRDVRTNFVPVNDVSINGDLDPESGLVEARVALAALQAEPRSKQRDAAIEKAQKQVDAAQARLAKLLASQFEVNREAGEASIRVAGSLLPERRVRQERTFPVVVPEEPRFWFTWPSADPGPHRRALGALCDRVTRLGHSSSLVRCVIVDTRTEPSLVPAADGEQVLRVVGKGQLARLEDAFAEHKAVEARVLPARPQRYGPPRSQPEPIDQSIFDHEGWVVFERSGGARPYSSRGPEVASAIRRALIEIHGAASLPASLSGHCAEGRAADVPHLAFVPLPYVGAEHADGSVQGWAIVPPRNLTAADRELLHRLLGRWEGSRGGNDFELTLGVPTSNGRSMEVKVRRTEVPSKASTRPSRWCSASALFVTATPIALDRNPGDLRSNREQAAYRAAEAARNTIMEACERIVGRRPIRVDVALSPMLTGAQHVREFTPWPPQPGKTRRTKVHAEIEFAAPVRGPLLIGAGRHFGLGFCLPVSASKGPAR